MAHVDSSTHFVCKGFHPNGSLLLSEDGKLAPESPALLPPVHAPGVQLCWVMGSAPCAAEARRPWGCPAAECSTPRTAPTLQRCSFAVSDVVLLHCQWPQADSFLAKLHSVWYIFLLAATEMSKFFFICYSPPSPPKNTSEHYRQQVSSYFSLILSKLRSNQTLVIKFIDCHTP